MRHHALRRVGRDPLAHGHRRIFRSLIIAGGLASMVTK
jgi:hypothetical protein